MRISLILLLVASAAIVLSGCPFSGGDSKEDVPDSVASDVTGQTPDVEADSSLPDATGDNGSSQVSDSATPDLTDSRCIAVTPAELDFGGVQCLDEKSIEVTVAPQADIHIELFWHTPGDGDETNEGPEAGSDLDLHLQHPFGHGYDLDGDGEPECWMDVDVNCFWFNLNPDWGQPGPENDPEMLLDDTDGAGPEVISFDNPEDMAYLVGVHYWNDHGFGDSWATVRVFVHGELAAQAEQVQLTDFDMWTAFRIDWPTGEVTLVTDNAGGYDIQAEFTDGYFIGDPETCGPF